MSDPKSSDPTAQNYHDDPSDDDFPGDADYSSKQSLRSFARHYNQPRPARIDRTPEDELRTRRKLERLKAWGKPWSKPH